LSEPHGLSAVAGVELRHLRYFVTVAEELHFGRAAQRLFLSQPSLSAQIRRLEDQLGTPLFKRTTREVKLTAAGQALFDRAQRILLEVTEAVAAAQDAAGVLSGELRLLFSHGSQLTAEPLLTGFGARYPGVRVQVLLGQDARLIEDVARGRADAAFVWELDDHPTLETLHVADEPTGVILPSDHPLAAHEAVPRTALQTERMILYDRDAGPAIVRALERVIWGDGEPPEDRIVRIRDATAAQESLQDEVARGTGISFVTSHVFELGHPPKTVYRPLDPPFAGRLFFAWPPTPLPARDALVEELRSATTGRRFVSGSYRSGERKLLLRDAAPD
jgi:DNA-binding transcriptional LysR family regulator